MISDPCADGLTCNIVDMKKLYAIRGRLHAHLAVLGSNVLVIEKLPPLLIKILHFSTTGVDIWMLMNVEHLYVNVLFLMISSGRLTRYSVSQQLEALDSAAELILIQWPNGRKIVNDCS